MTAPQHCSYVNGLAEGLGNIVYADGSRYDGPFVKGERGGGDGVWRAKGASPPPVLLSSLPFTIRSNSSRSVSEEVVRKPDSARTPSSPSSSSSLQWYVGGWAHDVRCGSGTAVLAKGNAYEGGFENDVPHGRGVMKYVCFLLSCIAPSWI